MAQTRKQRVLQEVRRKRQQRTITTVIIASVIIAIIVVTVVTLPHSSPNQVALPDYLSHCIFGNLVYHAHVSLNITINGLSQGPPANTFSSSCPQPIHTHADGYLHVETDQNRYYTLGDWFLLYGNWANNAKFAIFNSTQIFDNKAGPSTGHTLTMTVNGQPSTAFQTLQFPKNAGTSQAPCSPTPCAPFSVAITYY